MQTHALVGYLSDMLLKLLTILFFFLPPVSAMAEEFYSLEKPENSYTSLRELGSGANGWVYLVRSRADGQLYVVKKIYVRGREQKKFIRGHEYSKNISNDPKNKGYFPRVLDITPFKSSKNEKTFHGVVMEYFEGETLHDFLEANNDANVRVEKLDYVFRFFLEKILPIARDKHVLLGDLKFDNVLLRKNGIVSFFDFDGVSSKGEMDPDIGIQRHLKSPELSSFFQFHATSDLYALARSFRWTLATFALEDSLQGLSDINQKKLARLQAFTDAATKGRVKDRFRALAVWNDKHGLLADRRQFSELYKPRRVKVLRAAGRLFRDACSILFSPI